MMKSLTVIVLCSVAVNAYIPVGPKVGDNVHSRSAGAKVVGGTPAKVDQAPWQISLTAAGWFGESHICGGSLIGPKTALTAAHCCDGQKASGLKVKYGGLDRTKLAVSNQVAVVTMHPDWNANTIDSDYCILTLTNTVEEADNIKLIEVADQSPPTGAKAHLTGWGLTSGGSILPPTALQYAPMDILSQPECDELWKDVNPVTKTMICATNPSASGCNGDSGGPLVVDGKLVGVVSWGQNGCPADTTVRPTVYADPAVVKDWIKQNTQ